MIDLIISKQTIAIIFRPGHTGVWMIAFGTDKKKVFPTGFGTLESAVKEARRLGFGGYRAFKSDPVMFKDEKNWRSIYRSYATNAEEDYSN